MLNRSVFRKLFSIWKMEVYLFAATWNVRPPQFASCNWDMQSLHVSTGCVRTACLSSKLKQVPGVCIFPVYSHSHVSGEDKKWSGSIGTSMSSLDQSTLVPISVEPDNRCYENLSMSAEPPSITTSRTSSDDNGQFAPFIRLEIVRQRFNYSGFPENVVKLLMTSCRDATSAACQSALKNWHNSFAKRGSDPMQSDLIMLLFNYLAIRQSLLNFEHLPVNVIVHSWQNWRSFYWSRFISGY